jgi:KaiC/GvpD/RAD55 family RecA-like ATPase
MNASGKRNEKKNIPFGFGISDLDRLFEISSKLNVRQWSCAITGGNGSGKSILALHVAANYLANARANISMDPPVKLPRVIYVSSDLSFEQAGAIWEGFGLDFMKARKVILEKAYKDFKSQKELIEFMIEGKPFESGEIELNQIDPVNKEDVHRLLSYSHEPEGSNSVKIHFLDLQRNTTGDDWAFLNSLTGFLGTESKRKVKESENTTSFSDLIIIDAVEGLQTITGDVDAYGEGRSRRARVAQLARNCTATDTNLLFVIEKENDNIREPEQFITDYVFALRTKNDADYIQRAIEIEKFRGCAHARGEHEIMFRTGKGTFSGDESHIDDPRITWLPRFFQNQSIDEKAKSFAIEQIKDLTSQKLRLLFEQDDGKKTVREYSRSPLRKAVQKHFEQCGEPQHLAHIKVMESVHYWNAKFREDHYQLPLEQLPPKFGIDLIDSLLGTKPSLVSMDAPSADINREREFAVSKKEPKPTGSVTLFLGDAGTPKSKLARRFLSRALKTQELLDHIQPGRRSKRDSVDSGGIAIYFTTDMIDKSSVIDQLSEHIAQDVYEEDPHANNNEFKTQKLKIKEYIESNESDASKSRLFVRRLSARRLTTAYLLSVVKMQLEWAISQVDRLKQQGSNSIEYSDIYFVIDDWSQLIETHPNLAHDPLFLQSLLALIRSKRVMSIFVSTQPGKPYLPPTERNPSDLRRIDEQQVYFWNVSFHGERRTAITCLLDNKGDFDPEIYEIRSSNIKNSIECIKISREFGFYSGLESGEAKRVPLEVRLVGHSDKAQHTNGVAFPTYYKQASDLLENLFSSPDGKVLKVHHTDDYESQAVLADWTDGSPQGKTMVIQIDEFWNCRPNMLMNLERYWKKDVVAKWSSGKKRFVQSDSESDVYALWQTLDKPECGNPETDEVQEARERLLLAGKYVSKEENINVVHRMNLSRPDNHPYWEIDRIPLYWDFGFIIADKSLWESCSNNHVKNLRGQVLQIHEVWNELCLIGDCIAVEGRRSESRCDGKHVDWLAFISACHLISRQHPGTIPFDLESASSESIVCILLEIWASVAEDNMMEAKEKTKSFHPLRSRGYHSKESSTSSEHRTDPNLRQLVEKHPTSLFIASALVVQALSHIQGTHDRGIQKVTNSERFVASRQFYSTASPLLIKSLESKRQLCSLRLPGRYSVRGDWYLSVPNGSRSWLLAERCIDILCSRRMNLLRLIDGIGLPVRDIVHDSKMANIATSLLRWNKEIGVAEALTYGEVQKLGSLPANDNCDRDQFYWLWRSSIRNYEREAFYLRRWVGRMLFDKRKWLNTVISDGVESMLIDFFLACEKHAGTRGFSNKIERFDQFNIIFKAEGEGENEARYFWKMKETLQSALRKSASIQSGQSGQLE